MILRTSWTTIMFSSVFIWTMAGSRCECFSMMEKDFKRWFYFLPNSFIFFFSSQLRGVIFVLSFKSCSLLCSGQDLKCMKAFSEIHKVSKLWRRMNLMIQIYSPRLVLSIFVWLPIPGTGHFFVHHSASVKTLEELRCTGVLQRILYMASEARHP